MAQIIQDEGLVHLPMKSHKELRCLLSIEGIWSTWWKEVVIIPARDTEQAAEMRTGIVMNVSSLCYYDCVFMYAHEFLYYLCFLFIILS